MDAALDEVEAVLRATPGVEGLRAALAAPLAKLRAAVKAGEEAEPGDDGP